MYDLAIVNGRCWLDGGWQPVHLYIKEGKIAAHHTARLPARTEYDARGRKVIPGLIDSHVHFAMSAGRYVSADDFVSGGRAAAHGGVTTVIDFLDPFPTAEELTAECRRRMAQAERCPIDYAFHSSVADPDDLDRHLALSLEWGMPSVKVYTTYRPDLYAPPAVLTRLLERTAGGDLLMMVHAEADDLIDHSPHPVSRHGESRPVEAERVEAAWLAEEVRRTGGYCYVAHVSAGSTIQMLEEQYADLLDRRLFLESCPHYVLFDDSWYARADSWRATMTPPLRSPEEAALLRSLFHRVWAVSTDHCPFLRAEKAHPLANDIPMGVGGVEHAFSQMWALFGDPVIDRFTIHPARLQGLWPRKGSLNVGADADLVVLDETPRIIGPWEYSRCDHSLYAGRTACCTPRTVLVRGQYVILDGEDVEHQGQYLPRSLRLGDCQEGAMTCAIH